MAGQTKQPSPEMMAQAVRFGAMLEKVRELETGRVIEIKIVWPGWPGGKNPRWEANYGG
jgi:hypothetical protein